MSGELRLVLDVFWAGDVYRVCSREKGVDPGNT